MTTQPSSDRDKLCYANLSDDYAPSRLAAFTFQGTRHEVCSWAHLFGQLAEILIPNSNWLSVLHSPCLEDHIAEYVPNSGQSLPPNSKLIPNTKVCVLTHNSDNTLKSDKELKDAATALLAHYRKPTSLYFEYYSDEE